MLLDGLHHAPQSFHLALAEVCAQLFDSDSEDLAGGRTLRIPGTAPAALADKDSLIDISGHLNIPCSEFFQLFASASSTPGLQSMGAEASWKMAQAATLKQLGDTLLSHFSVVVAQPLDGEVRAGPGAEPKSLGGLLSLKSHEPVWDRCSICSHAGKAGLICGTPFSGKSSAWRLWAA